MREDFIQVSGTGFVLHGQPVRLRGYTFGSVMNLEHFMIGMPGTNQMIREAFAEVYGRKRADAFFRELCRCMVGDEDVRFLASLGINTIRIPLGYHWFMDDQQPDIWLQEGFDELEREIALCRAHGLRVILDLHSAPGGQNNDWHADNRTGQSLFWQYACFRRQTCRLWGEIARRYADDPWVVGYDVLNEPTYGLQPELFLGFYRDVTQAIRESDRHHIIFLEGDDFGRSFSAFPGEPEDPQTAFAMHFYPFVLEEDVLSPEMPAARRWEIFEQIFDRQLQGMQRLRRPVWCGESGYNIIDRQEDFYAELLLKNISLCETHGLSWSLWTYKDARRMGIVIPQRDSPWMRLRAKLESRWTHEWEQMTSTRLTRELWAQYRLPVRDTLAYDLEFRMRSILHRLEVEELLKPALRAIPWEEIRSYPASFAFSECEQRTALVDRLKAYLAGL